MAILQPNWLQNGDYVARLDRLLIQALVPTGGVTSPLALKPSEQGSPDMTVKILAGAGFAPGTDVTHQGMYHAYVDAEAASPTFSGTLPSAGQTRKDLVYLAINDPDAPGPAGDDATIKIEQGSSIAVGGTPVITEPGQTFMPICAVTLLSTTSSITDSIIEDLRTLCGGVDHVGTIQEWAGDGSLMPSGWVLCDGAVLDATVYPELLEIAGSTYGGDGSTTVGVPDMVDRMPVGAGNLYSRNDQGGAESVILVAATIPTHTHHNNHGHADSFVVNGTGTHYHNVGGKFAVEAFGYGVNIGGTVGFSTSPSTLAGGGHSHTVGGSVSNYTGDTTGMVESNGGSHENMPPYKAINFIIRVA